MIFGETAIIAADNLSLWLRFFFKDLHKASPFLAHYFNKGRFRTNVRTDIQTVPQIS